MPFSFKYLLQCSVGAQKKINKIRPILPIPFNASFFPPCVASLVCMQKISLIIIIVVTVVSGSSEL